jgi:hypothetical protein
MLLLGMSILEKTGYSAAATLACWSCFLEVVVHADCVTEDLRRNFICNDCLREEAILEHEDKLKEYKGFQHWRAFDDEEMHEIYFADYPFVATVVFHENEDGYLTDWWVSGTNLELKQPRLVMRLGVAVLADDLQELQDHVEMMWLNQLREMAIDSVLMEGFSASGFNSSFDYTRWVRERIARYHLMQHDTLWKGEKRSKILLTAGWHNLARQFGISQTQKLIASHEATLDFLDFIESLPLRGSDSDELKTSHINQRLKLAKDEGLVERKER